MLSKYMQPRGYRREGRTLAGRFRGGKLAPVMAVPFRESESGVINQTVTYELDPIAGRMITPITAEVVCVYVPAQAIDALKNPDSDYPGNAEVLRQKLLSGSPLFGLEEENEISKRLGVVPRSVDGTKYVNEAARLAQICAVNFLRQRKYVKATLLDSTAMNVSPAIIGQTVLDRLNGVLDPEDRVNGSVTLDFNGPKIPVKGMAVESWSGYNKTHTGTAHNNSGAQVALSGGSFDWLAVGDNVGPNKVYIRESKETPGTPDVHVSLDGIEPGSISLSDLYTAERMDDLVRQMRQLADQNPQYGEEIISRFAHGLSIDPGKQPFVLYERRAIFGTAISRAMDGPNLDKIQTDSVVQIPFTVPVPATEFGGVVITFCSVKPDETLDAQPHPILSSEWGARNYIADEMAIDPVPVTIRELYADCDQADENTVALYVGNNHLQRNYVNYGFNRHLDPTTVEAKTALWQIKIPMSVTPDSVIYPDDLDHYPFADNLAEVCQYNIQSNARIATPVIFGPTPVEELAQIETADIFQDAE